MLEIMRFALGDFDECWKLHDRILPVRATTMTLVTELVQAYGRRGWVKGAGRGRHWKVKTTSYLYQRTL